MQTLRLSTLYRVHAVHGVVALHDTVNAALEDCRRHGGDVVRIVLPLRPTMYGVTTQTGGSD